MKTTVLSGNTLSEIAQISADLASQRSGAAAQTSAIIECVVAAASPLMHHLFNGGTIQERLLFSLALVGACSNLKDENRGNYGLTVSICPDTVTEAINVYTQITGNDIKQHLPRSLLKFAEQRILN